MRRNDGGHDGARVARLPLKLGVYSNVRLRIFFSIFVLQI